MVSDLVFASCAARYLKRNADKLKREGVTHIFCYNYYAAEIFLWAQQNGFKCVLGQIDAGPAAGKLVKQLATKYGVDPSMFHDHYEGYIDKWRTEIANSSTIIVNSEWSMKLLISEGVPQLRMKVVPLSFEAESHHKARPNPVEFTTTEPLKVLLLGSLQIQKGVIEVFDAARELLDRPVFFNFAGSLKMPEQLLSRMPGNCRWLGFQDRGQVKKLFEEHQVLLFPTHSDGFGLVQLEAMAHGVPVIASRNCGNVVEQGVNGLILNEVSAREIRDVINRLIDEPKLVDFLAANTRVEKKFSFNGLVQAFKEID